MAFENLSQNWLHSPIALEQTPLRLTFATLTLAFAEVKPPCPRSLLAVRLSMNRYCFQVGTGDGTSCWPSCRGSLRAFAYSGCSPHFEIGSSPATTTGCGSSAPRRFNTRTVSLPKRG